MNNFKKFLIKAGLIILFIIIVTTFIKLKTGVFG